jgi:superfamily II DNA or RNA helicase
MTDLRDYQIKAVEEIEQNPNPCLVAPTGSGKTVIAAEVIEGAKHRHVLFLAHRRELIFQTRDHLA